MSGTYFREPLIKKKMLNKCDLNITSQEVTLIFFSIFEFIYYKFGSQKVNIVKLHSIGSDPLTKQMCTLYAHFAEPFLSGTSL